MADAWLARARTLRALAYLVVAQALVWLVPLRLWRGWLGLAAQGSGHADLVRARRLAAEVRRAVLRSPFAFKCLPQAMALSWLLRRRALDHSITLAVRPPEARGGSDSLHAWVAVGQQVVLGELPGPWITVWNQGR